MTRYFRNRPIGLPSTTFHPPMAMQTSNGKSHGIAPTSSARIPQV